MKLLGNKNCICHKLFLVYNLFRTNMLFAFKFLMGILTEAFIILKLNNDMFSQPFYHTFTECIDTTVLKLPDIITVKKKLINIKKKTISFLVFYLLYIKHLKVIFLIKFTRSNLQKC